MGNKIKNMVKEQDTYTIDYRSIWCKELDDRFASIAPNKGIRKWIRSKRKCSSSDARRIYDIRAGVELFLRKVNFPSNLFLKRKRKKSELIDIIKDIGLAKDDSEASQVFTELESYHYPETKPTKGYCSWHMEQISSEKYRIWAIPDY